MQNRCGQTLRKLCEGFWGGGGVVIGILNLQSSPLLPVLPLTIKYKTDQHWEPSMKETTITSGANADAKLQPPHPGRQVNS